MEGTHATKGNSGQPAAPMLATSLITFILEGSARSLAKRASISPKQEFLNLPLFRIVTLEIGSCHDGKQKSKTYLMQEYLKVREGQLWDGLGKG